MHRSHLIFSFFNAGVVSEEGEKHMDRRSEGTEGQKGQKDFVLRAIEKQKHTNIKNNRR